MKNFKLCAIERFHIIFTVLLGIFLSSCVTNHNNQLSDQRVDTEKELCIREYTALHEAMNKYAVVEGEYRRMNMSQILSRNIYMGRAEIVLSDGSVIALERGEAGIRSASEITQYDGKKVRVKGIIRPKSVLWGDGSEASIIAEYITAIQEIQIVK